MKSERDGESETRERNGVESGEGGERGREVGRDRGGEIR